MTILTKEETNKCLADIDIALSQMDAIVYENEALKAELTHAQTYKADAERYRWLKNSITDGLFIAQYNGSFSRWTGDKADEVIDKAMKESN